MGHRAWILLLLVGCGSTDLGAERRDGTAVVMVDAGTPADLAGADAASTRDVGPDAPPPDTSPDVPMLDGPPEVAPSRLDSASDPSPCGHLGDSCCPDLTCADPETVCVGNDPATSVCKRCGRTELNPMPCCPGNRCLDGGCCVHLLTPNLGPFCVGVGKVCFELNSSCSASGSCGPSCGGPGQPCCKAFADPYCSASGTACMTAPGAAAPSCVVCGQAGQPCCEQVESSYSIEPCADGLRCQPSAGGDRCQ